MRAAGRKKQVIRRFLICGFPLPSGCRRRPGHGPGPRCRAMRCALLRVGSAGLSMTFFSKRHKANEAEASVCTTLRENGTAPASGYPRAAALPAEGAHGVRRCAPFSRSAHLGKPRGFPRRCAPFSKMRTKNCGLSDGGKKIVPQAVGARAMPSSVPGSPPACQPCFELALPARERLVFPRLAPIGYSPRPISRAGRDLFQSRVGLAN